MPVTFFSRFKLFILLLMAGFLSGCFAFPAEESQMPPAFFALPEPPPWRTVEVARGNVELFSTISASHHPAQEEILNFPVQGALITGVYVNVGDEVSRGDVIASLDRSGLANDLERMNREEARLVLRIEQLLERHAHTLWMAEVSGVPVDDSFYITQQQDLQEDLHMIRLELDYIRRQYENRLVRATIDGVVTNAMTFAERQWTSNNHYIATIADHSLSFFVVSVREAQVIQIGERFEMDVAGNLFWVEVVDPKEYGIIRPETSWVEAILVVDGPATFAPRTVGRIHAVFATAWDVLYVPLQSVHTVNDKYYVYVIEDGLRRLREVEIGLEGTRFTEITKGLELGEVVVL
jgi:multidrug efflux pump subunit AcrA (membrane-fusion protein)